MARYELTPEEQERAEIGVPLGSIDVDGIPYKFVPVSKTHGEIFKMERNGVYASLDRIERERTL